MILYPPSKPVIGGQGSILYDEPLVFTCYSKGYPSPTFQWMYGDQLMSRNQTLTLTASSYVSNVICNVQNTMLPSYDVPETTVYGIRKYMYLTRPAVIKSLPYFVNVKVGDSLNVRCEPYGTPAPTVVWSKVGDETFVMFGQYLYVRYVQISVAGDYMCSIENVVILSNNSKTTTRDSKSVHIVVTDLSSPLPCPDHCQSLTALATQPPCSNTGDVSFQSDSTVTNVRDGLRSSSITGSPDNVIVKIKWNCVTGTAFMWSSLLSQQPLSVFYWLSA